MSSTRATELAEFLEQHLTPLNDINDIVATSSAECNYEDYENFIEAVDEALFEKKWTGVLQELKKRAENLLLDGEKCDVRNIFEDSSVAVMKFNLFIWYFVENGSRAVSSNEEVEMAVLSASSYVAMCAIPGANCDLFQVGLYEKCVRVARNCCQTILIGETVASKKAATKKVVVADDHEEDSAEKNKPTGPPRISVDSAERFICQLSTQFYGFLKSDSFSLDASCLMTTMEMIEQLGRLDLDARTCSRSWRALSLQEFRSLDRFTDRYTSFIHAFCESKYKTRLEIAFGRLIRPRIAFVPFPDEGSKSKITTEKKRAGELMVHFLVSRLELKPAVSELKMIQTVISMVYLESVELADHRSSYAQFILKILEKMPYKYAYDFVQLMNMAFRKTKTGGSRSLSIELSNAFLASFDFTAPDPGPVDDMVDEDHEDQEEQEDEEENEESEQEGHSVEEDDERERKKLKRKEEKKKENKKKAPVNIPRIEAKTALYNIIYLACLDRTASIRVHGAHSLAKILESESQRRDFQEVCQKINAEMDEQLGEIGEIPHDTPDETSAPEPDGQKKKKKTVDLMLGEQQIIEKYNKLKMMNKGETRVENDVIYMLIRRLATDDKAPVKKAASVLLKMYLGYVSEAVKFDTVLTLLQKLCRDKQVTVRKNAAEAITSLMHMDTIFFKDSLSSKWLHSLITMLNDTDNDITAHARRLIMEVLTPLLKNPSELTWALLDNIESVTNHRQYLMSTLKDAVREKRVEKSVVQRMKEHIQANAFVPDAKTSGAWMVFSQLCVQFEMHVDFAIEAFHSADLSMESNLVPYMIHIIENNIKNIAPATKSDLESSMRRTLTSCSLHSSHVRSVYHCLAKLMDGIGDRATNGPAFRNFANDLLVKCFDTIVESFEMFKNKEMWKTDGVSQERLLCVALTIASEVVSFSPQLIPSHERLGKTLSMIVNSHEERQEINPDIPSTTRPGTQMSEMASSQKTSGGLMSHSDGDGVLFSEKVRAVCVITLANMILAFDRLLKLMPMLVKQLQSNPSHQIRSNIVVAIGDICASYKTDRYAPVLAASLCDPSVLVRRHAIAQIARLISFGIFRFTGEIMIRMMLATLDANIDVRNDAKLYIGECMQAEDKDFFRTNFVQYMLALTQAKRLAGCSHDEDDRGQVDVAIGGGDPLARPSRIAIYTFMIESLIDRDRLEVKSSISQRIFKAIVNGEYDFSDYNVQCLLSDALLIMASKEMQVKFTVGTDPNDNGGDDPPSEVIAAAHNLISEVYLEQYMRTIVPEVLKLREFLSQHRSHLQRKCLIAIQMICIEHKNSIDRILGGNQQLSDEIKYEIERMEKRAVEANRILDVYLKKVAAFHKQQRRMSKAQGALEDGRDEVEEISEDPEAAPAAEDVAQDVEMRTPPRSAQVLATKTPLRSTTEQQSTPQTRPLSPKTLKKIRRSVGALITNNHEMRLAPPCLDDVTQMDEPQNQIKSVEAKDPEKANSEEIEAPQSVAEDAPHGTDIQEAPEVQKAPDVQEAPEAQQAQEKPENEPEEVQSDTSRARRRKTPNREDESIDADGQVWKKPKIAPKSPEAAAPSSSTDISLNVTQRRSRGVASSSSSIANDDAVNNEPIRNNKRKAIDDGEEDEASPTVVNIENLPRGTTPLFDTTKLPAGRQCSTPIRRSDDGNDVANMTFELNLSAITEKEDQKHRKSHAQILRQICEESEDDPDN